MVGADQLQLSILVGRINQVRDHPPDHFIDVRHASMLKVVHDVIRCFHILSLLSMDYGCSRNEPAANTIRLSFLNHLPKILEVPSRLPGEAGYCLLPIRFERRQDRELHQD